MRLITYRGEGVEKIGAWIEGDKFIVDLKKSATLLAKTDVDFQSMQSLIEGGSQCWELANWLIEQRPDEAVCQTEEVTLLAPIPRPIQLRDCLTFPEHLVNSKITYAESEIAKAEDPVSKRLELEQAGMFELAPSFYEYPVYYISNALSVHGPETEVNWPAYSSYIDYELEWAAVVGKTIPQGQHVLPESPIFGYTIFNDWSARDEQFKVMSAAVNLGPGPGKDFANGLGPCIVTADELKTPYNQYMKARVNGKEYSSGNTSKMHYKFEDLLEYLSRGHALMPGEIIGSGTVGTGCVLELGKELSSGDVIELEVQNIGVLRNRVVATHLEKSRK